MNSDEIIFTGRFWYNVEYQLTPLHFACHMGKTACALRLLEAGADPGAKDINGNTPSGDHRGAERRRGGGGGGLKQGK